MNVLKCIVVLLLYCKTTSSQISTFSNPVVDFLPSDLAVVKVQGSYYVVQSDNAAREIRILKSQFLSDFRNGEVGVVYRLPAGYDGFYPTSIKEYQDGLYLYFHMRAQVDEPWQMFVLKAHDPSNPLGMWNPPVRVLDPILWNITNVFGDTFQIIGQLYFVFSSPSGTNSEYHLYIVKMKSPVEVLEPIVLLREPFDGWECGLIHPSFIYNRETVYMIVSSCPPNTTTGYALGYMSIKIELDPLVPSNWEAGTGPVFQGSEEENVYNIHFPEFTTSPDGTETWMMYQASSNMSNLGPTRRIRIEKIDWNQTDGSPIFPVAKANGYQQKLPSGEPCKYLNPVSGELTAWSPNAYRVGDMYYSVSSEGGNLSILKSDQLYDYSNAEKLLVYTPPEGVSIGDGRILDINEDVYLYFYINNSSRGYWQYAIKAENKSNLMQNWGTPTRLLEDVLDGKGFHANILHQNNQNYLVWSSDLKHNDTTSKRVTYIAKMISPTEVAEPIVLLKEPSQSWECSLWCAIEYASVLYHKDTAFLVFSESSPDSADVSLSYMSIKAGLDPLDLTNWYAAIGPVFTRNDAENVYGTGRAWFTTSPDGLQDWMVYMASCNATNIAGSRSIRVQKMQWDKETGHPIFPTARGLTISHAIPSTLQFFTNPITDDTTVSPSVIRVGDFYYMLLSSDDGSEIELLKSGKLENFQNVQRKTVYTAPDDQTISGSSKLHLLNGQLFIYFSMEAQNSTSKLFVLQAHDSFNPMGVWDTNPISLAPFWDLPAFQSTLLEHDGNSYLVWITPNPASGFNSIYIGKMKNATNVLEPINLLRHPTELWECDGGCSNQAPYFIYNEGSAYMVHSVGAMCKAGNALTYMRIDKDNDPLNSVNWIKAPGKVFTENLDESIFCPAHATFTVSPDQKETWMVYHATNSPHVDAIKAAHIEKITWNQETGEPVFPVPHGLHHEQLVPSKNVE